MIAEIKKIFKKAPVEEERSLNILAERLYQDADSLEESGSYSLAGTSRTLGDFIEAHIDFLEDTAKYGDELVETGEKNVESSSLGLKNEKAFPALQNQLEGQRLVGNIQQVVGVFTSIYADDLSRLLSDPVKAIKSGIDYVSEKINLVGSKLKGTEYSELGQKLQKVNLRDTIKKSTLYQVANDFVTYRAPEESEKEKKRPALINNSIRFGKTLCSYVVGTIKNTSLYKVAKDFVTYRAPQESPEEKQRSRL